MFVAYLREWEQLAQRPAEHPPPGERLQGREGDGEQAHEDVGEGQVDDEVVGHGAHLFGADDGQDYKDVA